MWRSTTLKLGHYLDGGPRPVSIRPILIGRTSGRRPEVAGCTRASRADLDKSCYATEAMLETPRLRLVPLCADHLDLFAAMYADPEVIRFLEPAPLDRAEAWRRLALHLGHWTLRGYGGFACLEKASGVFIGNCGPWFPEGWPALEIGYTFRREYWGRGYASEAASACARYAYEVLGTPEVISLVHPGNARSQRVAERGGAKLEREIVVRGYPVRLFNWPRR